VEDKDFSQKDVQFIPCDPDPVTPASLRDALAMLAAAPCSDGIKSIVAAAANLNISAAAPPPPSSQLKLA
jgi:hypothetical protein